MGLGACPHGVEHGCDECIMRKGNTIAAVLAAIMPPRPTRAELTDRLLKSEALNAELARMLRRLEWRGCSEEHAEECPLCLSPRWWDGEENAHNDDCALAALLKKATTE